MTAKNYYVVLDDGDTYSGEQGAFVVLLKDDGERELESANSMLDVSDDNVFKKVYISDLIDCWIEKNGHF